MRTSESIKELAMALAKAQGALKGAKKDAKNPFFKSNYADLEACFDACREPLALSGFSIIQGEVFKDNGWVLETRLLHSSGQWVETDYPIKPVKEDPQAWKSANTYARRSALTSMVGLHESDDDGNAASQGKPAPAMIKAKDQRPHTPGEFVVQIGTNKGKKIKDIPNADLEKALKWCIDNEKYPDYQEAILNHLDIYNQKLTFPDEALSFTDA